ncbi:MAG: cache domain-containing protein, partial [Acidisphaera sp.]|nr:cache domain-containing protein [Acidisphaera sp.]
MAAILVPVAAFGAVLIWRFSELERNHYRDDALQIAQQASATIDREIVGYIAASEALAVSPALQAGGDLASFASEVQGLLRTRGSYLSVHDRNGQQIIDSTRPFGTGSPVANDPVLRDVDQKVFATGKPAVSDLFSAAAAQRLLVTIAVPVSRGDAVTHVLNMSVEPQHFGDVLADAAPPGITLSLVDGRDRVIARSQRSAEFVGRTATAGFVHAATGARGTWMGSRIDGTPVLGAYVRSGLSGWRIGVGVPLAIIEAPVRR